MYLMPLLSVAVLLAKLIIILQRDLQSLSVGGQIQDIGKLQHGSSQSRAARAARLAGGAAQTSDPESVQITSVPQPRARTDTKSAAAGATRTSSIFSDHSSKADHRLVLTSYK